MNTDDLIIHLIREELRNKLLMFSLEDLGFDCSYYMLNVSRVILELAGFKEKPDELYDWYCEWIEKALKEITFLNMDETITKWADSIWKAIQDKRG
jgi:hypothetical protein